MSNKKWHPEDIKAEIRKRGKTLQRLAQDYGVASSAVRGALRRPLYTGEQVIAHFLGLEPQVLWPGRYDQGGAPYHPHARARHVRAQRLGRHRLKRRVA